MPGAGTFLVQNRRPARTFDDAEAHPFGDSNRDADVYDAPEMTRDDL